MGSRQAAAGVKTGQKHGQKAGAGRQGRQAGMKQGRPQGEGPQAGQAGLNKDGINEETSKSAKELSLL